MFSAATDSDRRDQLRSQSMDRKSYYGDDYHSNLRGRLMTPEFTNEKSDYSYVNYHDTSLARTSIPREPDHSRVPSKGILKNKQVKSLEVRLEMFKSLFFSLILLICFCSLKSFCCEGMKNILDRLKQYLSGDKRRTPEDSLPCNSIQTVSSNKKKSFLSLRRRRTTEMRLGPDGKIITAPFDDDYKRPASPIDRIKSFFRKSKEALTPPVTSQTTTGNHEYSQYNKARTNPSANYNRYSYISTASERPTRYWYDDSHLY
ncbi:unnamed protein product [Dracunculus medinensis]|uniref:Uncharacterized protein n=1 Tax=Dracunculus medinensis TaxID=318479 RepID=A0A0N4U432_DRAME|nr:unnamed protein product [Dracunculus medinensis]